MQPTLFGLETELAFSATAGASRAPVVARDALIEELFCLASEHLCSLPDPEGQGMFLGNGSRFYLDCGTHPELCTPECQSPLEVVRWQLAGERLLAGLVQELRKLHPDIELALFRCNVDYSGRGKTWGCHESYQHRTAPARLAPLLIPHLVSRLVYTGAGGFDNRGANRAFLLSPRVSHLVHEIGPGGSPERGIYHAKNEPLSEGGYSRLHLMCGESVSSQLSNYLKVGATALVVRCIDAGQFSAESLALSAPLRAMRTFAGDPDCRARVPLADGRLLTAVEIQTEYLALVEAQLSARWMPAWAPELCRRWRRALEQLAADPTLLSTSLDWAIKYALFRDHAARAGIPFGSFRAGTELAARLCEIDTRFGALGEDGLFHALDRAGVLEHQLPELGSVEEATEQPPPGARAQARGRAIASLQKERSRYQCTWDRIYDQQDARMLDMSNAFATRPRWRRRDDAPKLRTPAELTRSRIDLQIHEANRRYHGLELAPAVQALSVAVDNARLVGDAEREALARFWSASAHQDAGDLGAAQDAIAPALNLLARRVSYQTLSRVRTRHALILIERSAAPADIEEAMRLARAATRQSGGEVGRSRVSMLEGRALAARGEYAAAIVATERAIAESDADPVPFTHSSYLRRLVEFAFALGDLERALSGIERWRAQARFEGPRSYSAVTLRCAEAELARREGRPIEALELAVAALDASVRSSRNRPRLEALLAVVECALHAGEPDRAAPLAEELLSWRDIQVTTLRVRIRRVERQLRRAPRSA